MATNLPLSPTSSRRQRFLEHLVQQGLFTDDESKTIPVDNQEKFNGAAGTQLSKLQQKADSEALVGRLWDTWKRNEIETMERSLLQDQQVDKLKGLVRDRDMSLIFAKLAHVQELVTLASLARWRHHATILKMSEEITRLNAALAKQAAEAVVSKQPEVVSKEDIKPARWATRTSRENSSSSLIPQQVRGTSRPRTAGAASPSTPVKEERAKTPVKTPSKAPTPTTDRPRGRTPTPRDSKSSTNAASTTPSTSARPPTPTKTTPVRPPSPARPPSPGPGKTTPLKTVGQSARNLASSGSKVNSHAPLRSSLSSPSLHGNRASGAVTPVKALPLKTDEDKEKSPDQQQPEEGSGDGVQLDTKKFEEWKAAHQDDASKEATPATAAGSSPPRQSNNAFYERLFKESEAKRKSIEDAQRRKQEAELAECTFTPIVPLAASRVSTEPIYERLHRESIAKAAKLEAAKEELQKELSFVPRVPNARKRDDQTNEPLHEKLWREASAKKLAIEKNEALIKEKETEGCTFQPVTYSTRPRPTKGGSSSDLKFNEPIFDRLHKDSMVRLKSAKDAQALRESMEVAECTFVPIVVNEMSGEMLESRQAEGSVYDRLHKAHMDKQLKLEEMRRAAEEEEESKHKKRHHSAPATRDRTVYDRLHKELEIRKQALDEKRKSLMIEQGITFTPKTNAGSSSPTSARSSSIYDRSKEALVQLEEKKKELAQAELAACTFTPQITAKAQKLYEKERRRSTVAAEEQPAGDSELSSESSELKAANVGDRLYSRASEYAERKENLKKKLEAELTFKPWIAPMTEKIMKDKPVHWTPSHTQRDSETEIKSSRPTSRSPSRRGSSTAAEDGAPTPTPTPVRSSTKGYEPKAIDAPTSRASLGEELRSQLTSLDASLQQPVKLSTSVTMRVPDSPTRTRMMPPASDPANLSNEEIAYREFLLKEETEDVHSTVAELDKVRELLSPPSKPNSTRNLQPTVNGTNHVESMEDESNHVESIDDATDIDFEKRIAEKVQQAMANKVAAEAVSTVESSDSSEESVEKQIQDAIAKKRSENGQ